MCGTNASRWDVDSFSVGWEHVDLCGSRSRDLTVLDEQP